MPDNFDRATDLTERERESCIERARAVVADMPGPARCMRCGLSNDRAALGFCICLDCVGEINGSAEL